MQLEDRSRDDAGGFSDARISQSLYGVAQSSTFEEFCSEWLSLQCHSVASVRDASLVSLGDIERKQFAPVAIWPPGTSVSRQLVQTAERSLSEDRSLVVRPDEGAARPGFLTVASPIHVAHRLRGVVALDLEPREDSEVEAVLRRLDNGCAWLEGVLARHGNGSATAPGNGHGATARAAGATAAPSSATGVKLTLELLATVLQHEGLGAACLAFVTELATRFDCDRACLGFVTRRKGIRLEAMSHTSHFNKKSDLVRAIERAMEECADQESSVRHPQPESVRSSDFRITQAHADLSKTYGSGAVHSFPLSRDGEIVGVLTLEKPEERGFDAEATESLEAIASAAGAVLDLKRREERSLLARMGEALTGGLKWLVGRKNPYWKAAGILVIAVLAFLCLVKGDYRVSADTVLEGSVQRAAAAPFNGIIHAAPRRAGDEVKEGDVLCTLDRRDLEVEAQKWRSQRAQLERQHQQARAQHNLADFKILEARIDQAAAQLALIDEQLKRTEITAPFDGIVVSGDLSQSIGGTVERGQVLFEVAPLEGYRVILEVDERDIGDIETGQKGHILLSSMPTEKQPITVTNVTPVSASNEGRNYFRVEAHFDGEPNVRLRPGMEGVGKVEVGERRLIWIYTHRAIDWLRLTLWSWMP